MVGKSYWNGSGGDGVGRGSRLGVLVPCAEKLGEYDKNGLHNSNNVKDMYYTREVKKST